MSGISRSNFEKSKLNKSNTQNDETNENISLNQEESSIINNDTSITAPLNPSSLNQTALRSEVSKLDTAAKSSPLNQYQMN